MPREFAFHGVAPSSPKLDPAQAAIVGYAKRRGLSFEAARAELLAKYEARRRAQRRPVVPRGRHEKELLRLSLAMKK